jgi:hypothetical protein
MINTKQVALSMREFWEDSQTKETLYRGVIPPSIATCSFGAFGLGFAFALDFELALYASFGMTRGT